MKAMIFAAGLGTRLKPITDSIPKALVGINGQPLLKIAIGKLIKAGINEIIINVHHFAEQIIDYLNSNENFGIRIEISDERELLLDTGGGLKKASWFFDDDQPFLVYNVDVLSDISIFDFYNYHILQGGLVTLAVRDRKTARYLVFDNDGRLSGWANIQKNEKRMTRNITPEEENLLAYSGIQIISPKLFNYIQEESVFSIIDVYLRLAGEHKILAYNHNHTSWMDVGKPEQLDAIIGNMS